MDRQEFSQYLSKQVEEKLTKAVQCRSQVERERQRWAQSVLIKHQRQYKKVEDRRDWDHGSTLVKREYSYLKKNDQTLNLSDIRDDYQLQMDKVKLKHKRLQEEWEANKVRMEKLQIKQSKIEWKKKNELYKNKWCQSLKPRNKLGDIIYQKEIEEGPDLIIRRGATELDKMEIETIPDQSEIE